MIPAESERDLDWDDALLRARGEYDAALARYVGERGETAA